MRLSRDKKNHLTYLILTLLAIIISAINPEEYAAWFAEVLPVIIGIVINLAIYKNFKFTNLAYFLMFFVSVLMVIGGHYTYGKVPIPQELNDFLIKIFKFNRNHYDRIGHFFQGFTIAIISREVLLIKTKLNRDKWLFFIVLSITLAIGAGYELIEWMVAMFNGSSDGGVFVGAQGDSWDAQWDMFLALLGANVSLLGFTKLQDKMLKEVYKKEQILK